MTNNHPRTRSLEKDEMLTYAEAATIVQLQSLFETCTRLIVRSKKTSRR